jgi:hypothetical protein
MATWDDVASVVGELPLSEERSPREWRVGKKLIAWERPMRTSDHEALTALGIEPPQGDILGVRVADEGVKLARIADEPTCTSPPRISTAIRLSWSDSLRLTRWASVS